MMPNAIQPDKKEGAPFDEQLPDFDENKGGIKLYNPKNAQAATMAHFDIADNLFIQLYKTNPKFAAFDRDLLISKSHQALIIDIETGANVHADRFKPEFKEPRITASGKPHASDKTIAEQEKEWREGLALDPLTAEILAIGLKDFNGTSIILGTQPLDEKQVDSLNYLVCRNEADMLQIFWKVYKCFLYRQTKFVGGNIKGFDFPMLAFRSWVNAIKAEWNTYSAGWANDLVDLCDIVYAKGSKKKMSVDNLSKALLGEGKIGSGKDFATLFNAEQTRIAALRYLESDLVLEYKCYKRIFFNQ